MSAYNDQVAAYKDRCREISDHTFTGLAVAVGQKLSLFTKLAECSSHDKPVTSQQFADFVNLRERYVREWLHCMVVSKLIQCAPDGQTFWLCDAAKEAFQDPQTFAWMTAMPMVAWVFDTIVECFRKDGPLGTSYDQYSSFHEWMASVNSQHRSQQALLNTIVPSVEGLDEQLTEGKRVLDLGCGRGVQVYWLAQKYTKSNFVGIDFTASAIAYGKQNYKLANLEFHEMNAKSLPSDWSNTFDVVTMFDSFHDQARPDLALDEVSRILRVGGRLVVIDIAAHTNVMDNINDPKATVCYLMSLFHCMPVSLNEPGGLGLGACYGREKAFEIFNEHGFKDPKVVHEDGMNMVMVCAAKA